MNIYSPKGEPRAPVDHHIWVAILSSTLYISWKITLNSYLFYRNGLKYIQIGVAFLRFPHPRFIIFYEHQRDLSEEHMLHSL